MAETRDQVEAAAIGWVIRLRDGEAEEWERFVEWLEADPQHASVYEEIALADASFDQLPRHRPRPLLVGDEEAPGRRFGRRAFAGWGIAAALVLSIGYVSLRPIDDRYTVATGPGERRSVQLADGSRIDLNGATEIVLDEDDPRFARLSAGEALFSVRPDPSTPFRVEAGNVDVRVLGTVFNVVRAEAAVEVAVAEGAVLFDPGGQAVKLQPGMSARQEKDSVVVTRGNSGDVGAWRQARLSYSSAPLSRVAADLSRSTGIPVTVSDEVAARKFSGVILLDADRDQLFRRLSALLEVEARRSGDGWILTSRAGAQR